MRNDEIKRLIASGVIIPVMLSSGCTSNSTTNNSIILEVNKNDSLSSMDVIKLSNEFKKYVLDKTKDMYLNIDDRSFLSYIYLLNEECINNDTKMELINLGLSEDINVLKKDYETISDLIGYYNGSCLEKNIIKEDLISLKDFVKEDKYKSIISKLDNELYNNSKKDPESIAYFYENSMEDCLCGYEVNEDSTITEFIIKLTYEKSNLYQINKYLSEDKLENQTIINNSYSEMIVNKINENDKQKIKSK